MKLPPRSSGGVDAGSDASTFDDGGGTDATPPKPICTSATRSDTGDTSDPLTITPDQLVSKTVSGPPGLAVWVIGENNGVAIEPLFRGTTDANGVLQFDTCGPAGPCTVGGTFTRAFQLVNDANPPGATNVVCTTNTQTLIVK